MMDDGDNPVDIDDDRQGYCGPSRESNLHYEAKLEIQAFLRQLVCYSTYVEWVLPWCRKKLGRRFSWGNEDRTFNLDQYYAVNGCHVPTRDGAIACSYAPLFIFDVVCEGPKGVWAVFEAVCSNPTEPDKRRYLAEHGILLYEIDAARMAPKYQNEDGYKTRDFTDVRRACLPLLGGGEVSFSELIAKAQSDGAYSGGRCWDKHPQVLHPLK